MKENPRAERGIDHARPAIGARGRSHRVNKTNDDGVCPRVFESWELAGGPGIEPGKMWRRGLELWFAGDSVLAPGRTARKG